MGLPKTGIVFLLCPSFESLAFNRIPRSVRTVDRLKTTGISTLQCRITIMSKPQPVWKSKSEQSFSSSISRKPLVLSQTSQKPSLTEILNLDLVENLNLEPPKRFKPQWAENPNQKRTQKPRLWNNASVNVEFRARLLETGECRPTWLFTGDKVPEKHVGHSRENVWLLTYRAETVISILPEGGLIVKVTR